MINSGVLEGYTLYAVRANDIYPTISNKIDPDLSLKLSRTKDIGAMSNMIKIIKNARSVIELDKYKWLVMNIGIDQYAVEHYLKELQDLQFIHIAGSKVENRVPIFNLEIYESLGRKLESYNPSELEMQHFELLNNVAELPAKVVDLFDTIDVTSDTMKLFKRIGTSCGYLDSYLSPNDGNEIIYSPIYWEENPEKLFELIDKYQYNNVVQKMARIRQSQGLPMNDANQDVVLAEAISLGCLPTNSVSSAGGEQYFVFTPATGVKKYEKDIIKKARQIVSCARYGERFAQITKIRSIRAVLNALVNRGKLNDHTENIYQYAMLIEMGLVFPVKAYYGHEIHFNDTKENRRIFDIALELLKTGTVVDNEAMVSDSDLEKVFRDGKVFQDEIVSINKFKEKIPSDSDTLQRVGDYLRGVDDDVFR